MTTGASPISAEVFDFLRICFGATVIEVRLWLHPAWRWHHVLPLESSGADC